jgi:HEAT repeat protein
MLTAEIMIQMLTKQLQAAEALGAIGAQRSVALLEQFAQDPAPEVSQTCQVC